MGGYPNSESGRVLAEAAREYVQSLEINSTVVENLRTRRFRRGRCYEIPDAEASRIALAATAVGFGKPSAERAKATLDVFEREIAPFLVLVPGSVGHR